MASPGSVLPRLLARVFFTPSRLGARLYLPQLCPLLVPNCLLQFLALDNTLPQYILGRNSAGEQEALSIC